MQRRAARYTLNQYSYHSSVSAMLQHLCWPTLQQRRNLASVTMLYKLQHQLVSISNSHTQFHQEIINSYSHSLPQIIMYTHFSLEQSGCGNHYQTRWLIAQTWILSSLVPNHFYIVNILSCFYHIKKNEKKKMFIHKCIYVIQILVSLACLLKSLQHIEVQKYPVDVDFHSYCILCYSNRLISSKFFSGLA